MSSRIRLLLATAILVFLALVPPAQAQWSLAQTDGERVELPVSRDPRTLLQQDLLAKEEHLEQRLGRQQERSRWILDRLDRKRRAMEADEARLRAQLQAANKNLGEDERAVAGVLLATFGEIFALLRTAEDLQDATLQGLLDAAAEVRRLTVRLDDPHGWEGEVTSQAIDAEIEDLKGRIAEESERWSGLLAARTAAEQTNEEHLNLLEGARSTLLGVDLRALEVGPKKPGLPEVGGEPDGEGKDVEPGISGKDKSMSPWEDALARLEVRRLESQCDVDRIRGELLHLDAERQAFQIPVLQFHVERWRSRRDEVAAREKGGLLNAQPGLWDPSALRAGVDHSRSLLLDPWAALTGVRSRLVWSSDADATRLSGAQVTGLAILGLLAFVLVGRIRLVLAKLEPDNLGEGSFLAASLAILPVLPLSLVCSTLAFLELVPPSLRPLLRFSAIAPPLVAGLVAGSSFAFRDSEDVPLRPSAARYFRGLVRLGCALACLVLGASALLPLFGYPEQVRGLIRAGLLLWLLLGYLGILLRKREILTLFGASDGDQSGGLLANALRRFYRVFTVGPIVLYVLYAIGYINLAQFLLRGGLVTIGVLLLAPWAHQRLRNLCEKALGYPRGGGWLALSPEASEAAYRSIVPVLLLLEGGASLGLLASGWGYGGLFGNLRSAVSYPLLDIGGSSISFASLLLFTLTIALTYLLSRWVLALLNRHLYPLYDLDRGMRSTLDTLVRYSLFAIGIIVGLDVVGVGLGFLTVFAGVVGIGLGFGSQTLASNFIAGLILLVTRPVRVDDVIEVSGIVGRVVRISSYATIIRTLNNTQVIVPNSSIIDGSLINWTVGDRRVRISLEVGVAYGSDTAQVKKLLLQAADEHPKVLKRPVPLVRFDGFGDSSLAFTLLPWTTDPDARFIITSDLRFAIDEAFRANDIEIAFPQSDIHLRTGDGVVKVALQSGAEAAEVEAELRGIASGAGGGTGETSTLRRWLQPVGEGVGTSTVRRRAPGRDEGVGTATLGRRPAPGKDDAGTDRR